MYSHEDETKPNSSRRTGLSSKGEEYLKLTKSKGNSTTTAIPDKTYDTKTGIYSKVGEQSKNTQLGKKISLEEATRLAPSLVAETGEYKEHYNYYYLEENGHGIVRREAQSTKINDVTSEQESEDRY